MLFQGVRRLTIILLMFIFVGCGISEDFDRSLPYNSRVKINHKEIQILQAEVRLMNERLEIVESRLSGIDDSIFNMKITINKLDEMIIANSQRMDDLQLLIDSNKNDVDDALILLENDYIDRLNIIDEKYEMILTIVAMEMQELFDMIKDQEVEAVFPCGTNNSKEILLSTTVGLVAYFQQGTSRYLSILTDGTYLTTDGFACQFTIVNGELL